jgi:hypothetical protein
LLSFLIKRRCSRAFSISSVCSARSYGA